jgi:hypothetical protein
MVNPVASTWEAAQFIFSHTRPELLKKIAHVVNDVAVYTLAQSVITSRDSFEYYLGLTAAAGAASFYFANTRRSNLGMPLSATAFTFSVTALAMSTIDLYTKVVAVQDFSLSWPFLFKD